MAAKPKGDRVRRKYEFITAHRKQFPTEVMCRELDVMLVGEIRDGETAEIATQAALTRHLVLSTLHTNDAASALTRLLDLDVVPFLVASTVEAVLAQRLLRENCAAQAAGRRIRRRTAGAGGAVRERADDLARCRLQRVSRYRLPGATWDLRVAHHG
jgi:type II secretory ATPase GspE/PulE/Tfp pilus assembly ATPase PilB-like protein